MFKFMISLLVLINTAFGFQIRTGDRGEDFRLVFQAKEGTQFDVIQVENSLIVKVEELYEDSKLNLSSSPVSNIEIYHSEDRKRAVVYIQTVSPQVKVFTLSNPNRLVIDIKKEAVSIQQPQTVVSKPQTQQQKKSYSIDYTDLDRILTSIQQEKDTEIEVEASYYKSYKGKKKVIVIDPGHGGHDPGATAHGLAEKDINLKVAKILKAMLEKDQRFVVYLTREDDRFIPLYERTLIALEKKADLFISIHTNASENPNLHGTYAYTLNLRGATSKLARMVEERENKTVLNVVKVSANPNVNKIVADMAISHTMTEGLNFAKFVEVNFRNMVKDIEFKRIESANFAVLKTPSIPSILFETAFITNERDAQLLRDDKFLEKVAKVLYKSTSDYFFKYRNLVFNGGRN